MLIASKSPPAAILWRCFAIMAIGLFSGAQLFLSAKAQPALDGANDLPICPPLGMKHQEHTASPSSMVDNITSMFENNEFPGYKMVSLLGQGAFGVVYKVRPVNSSDPHEEYAMKIAQCGSLKREFEITQSLSMHDFVINVFGYGRSNNTFHWDFYLMPVFGKTLRQLVNDGQLKNATQIRKLVNQIVVNMQRLHNLPNGTGVAHNDYHLGNLAINPQHWDRVLVFDFGDSTRLSPEDVGASINDYAYVAVILRSFEAPNDNETDPESYAFPHGSSEELLAPVDKVRSQVRAPKPSDGATQLEKDEWMLRRTAKYFVDSVQTPFEVKLRQTNWIGENFGPEFLKDWKICHFDQDETGNIDLYSKKPCWQELLLKCPYMKLGVPVLHLEKIPAMFGQNLFVGYALISILGTGSTGAVYKVKRNADNAVFALKIMECGYLRDEFDITQSVAGNDFIIRLGEFGQIKNEFHWEYYTMPVLGKTIQSLIKSNQLIHPLQLKKVMNQVMFAMTSLQNLSGGNGIAFNDYHFGNIALNTADNTRIVIFDFGQAQRTTADDASAALTDYLQIYTLVNRLKAPRNATTEDESKYAFPSNAARLLYPVIDRAMRACSQMGPQPSNETLEKWLECRRATNIKTNVEEPFIEAFKRSDWIGPDFGLSFQRDLPICSIMKGDNRINLPCWQEQPETSAAPSSASDHSNSGSTACEEHSMSMVSFLFFLFSICVFSS